jgi:Holliday junction resolvase RusA-like endonuclease
MLSNANWVATSPRTLWTCHIEGNPATKKNSNRLVRAKGRFFILPSAAHERWFRSAFKQVASRWYLPPLTCPVAVKALFLRADNRPVDLVNAMQALADLLERAGVVENDRQIRAWDGSRLGVDRQHPRIELELTEVAG